MCFLTRLVERLACFLSLSEWSVSLARNLTFRTDSTSLLFISEAILCFVILQFCRIWNRSCFHYCIPCNLWQPRTRIIENNGRALVQSCSIYCGTVSRTPTVSVTKYVATSDNIVTWATFFQCCQHLLSSKLKVSFIFNFIEYCFVLRLCRSVL